MIEVLVVIAITVILFGLLIRPLIDTLRYTKDAQLNAAAQDSARKTMEILTREIGSAAYVFDNSSHAFDWSLANGTSTVTGIPTAQYTNFLNVDVPMVDSSGNLSLTGTVAHLYNAKLDMVMARHQGSALTDPTAGNEPINLESSKQLSSSAKLSGSAVITPTPLQFPLAPGVSMIRYFVGLQNPDAPYCNPRDHVNIPNLKSNTYVLYRAQFNPYNKNTDGSYKLFARDAGGQPIIDDPDFFRPVKDPDVDWLDPTHATYGSGTADLTTANHNLRYEAWKQIAKPVINAPEIDLLELPHKTDRTIDYDPYPVTATNEFSGIAHFGADHDPVGAGKDYPVVRTSTTFSPGVESTDAAPSTTAEYTSAGVAGGASGYNHGLPYIPSVYQSSGQSWTRPYTVFLYPQKAPDPNTPPTIDQSNYLYITQAIRTVADPADAANPLVNPGDVVEYQPGGGAVYNLTPPPGKNPFLNPTITDIVPCSVSEDQGTINFSVPSVPDQLNFPYIRTWIYPLSAPSLSNPTPSVVIDLTGDCTMQLTTSGSPRVYKSPLNNTIPSGAGKPLNFAFIVPGSLRVYGPDMDAGPDYFYQYPLCPGSTPGTTVATPGPLNSGAFMPGQIPPGGGVVPPGYVAYAQTNDVPMTNQYQVDYYNGTLTFSPSTYERQIYVMYDYQANVRPIDTTKKIMLGDPNASPPVPDNPGNPMVIKVVSRSRDMITANVGVRFIDSVGNAQNIMLNNSLKVGNIRR